MGVRLIDASLSAIDISLSARGRPRIVAGAADHTETVMSIETAECEREH